jgi:hypothetical protein
MKFPYVPLDAILAEVETQFKTLNKQGRYSENDAYNYAIEAAREIGMNNYDESTCLIRIDGHIGALPKDFYLAGEVHAVDCTDDTLSPTTVLAAFKESYRSLFKRLHILQPGNSATVRLCKGDPIRMSPHMPSFVLKVPPGVIRASFKVGYVEMQYYHLPKDERGVIQIQDEICTIKCVKAYVLMNMLKEDYVMAKLARYIYKDIEDEFYTYLSQAKGMQKLPDQTGMEAEAFLNRNRYNDFKL